MVTPLDQGIEQLTLLGISMNRTSKLVAVLALSAMATTGCAVDVEDASAQPKEPVGTKASHPKKAKIKHKTIRIKKHVPFSVETIRTPELDKGETLVGQKGHAGVTVKVVRLTLKNGVEVGRDVVNSFMRSEPVDQVTYVGTRTSAPAPEPEPAPSSNCDSNYADACVPIASDVDCAGGSGDGPEYVQGPVTVVGDDVYDLNRDDDNIACDS